MGAIQKNQTTSGGGTYSLVMTAARSGAVCVTVLICPNHQGLIPQGEHLGNRCHCMWC